MLVRRISAFTVGHGRWLRQLGAASSFVLLLSLLGPAAQSLGASPVRYFVDCSAGNDANTGRSETSAWRTLAKASAALTQPGDSLLFKRGCTWQATLFLRRSGTAELPITVGAYGTGNLPKIQNGNDQVAIHGSYLIIENIHVRSDPTASIPRAGTTRSACDADFGSTARPITTSSGTPLRPSSSEASGSRRIPSQLDPSQRASQQHHEEGEPGDQRHVRSHRHRRAGR